MSFHFYPSFLFYSTFKRLANHSYPGLSCTYFVENKLTMCISLIRFQRPTSHKMFWYEIEQDNHDL